MTSPCAVCGRPGPEDREAFVAGNWFHVDRDGVHGPLPSVWICGDHLAEPEPVMRALQGATVLREVSA